MSLQNQKTITQSTNNVQSVHRALELLKIIAKQTAPISLAKITEQSGLNRTTVWRLLTTLEADKFITRDLLSKNYELGYNAAMLCPEATKQYLPLIRLARPFMERIAQAAEEDVLLTVPRFGGILTIDQIHSEHGIGIKNYLNVVSQLHCSSNGKLLLSYLPESELALLLREPLEQVTAKTITDPALLREAIRQIAKTGYGIVLEENSENENGISTAICQNNMPIAFLNISGPNFRFTKERMLAIAPQMQQFCHEIENLISYS